MGGGCLTRPHATGYGLVYFVQEMLNDKNDSLKGKTVVISGSGNVAIYAVQKAVQLGAKVVAMSDSNGYIYDKNGIDLDLVKQLKEVERKRIKEYLNTRKDAVYTEGCSGIWTIPCDVALPCATQNEVDEASAKILVKNGCKLVAEGANMPSTPEAIAIYQANNIMYAPGKASNAGGVAVSALEMCQNSMRYSWTFEEVDAKLRNIMKNIYIQSSQAAKEFGKEGDLVFGANIAGFLKVGKSMLEQGLV